MRILDASQRMVCQGLLQLGGIPPKSRIVTLNRAGHCQWVNVSGVDIQAIYPSAALRCFTIHNFMLHDVFSSFPQLSSTQTVPLVSPSLFTSVCTRVEEQQQFRHAVDATCECLSKRQPLFIFCYYGQGRSPAVAFSALRHALGFSLERARACVTGLRPQAHISAVTIAAARWYAGEK